jgi:transposase
MDVVVERCAGLDVHRDSVVATVRLPGSGKSRRRRQQQSRSFGTTIGQLETLADWLEGLGVTLVGMEATGVYWKPVFYVLERRFECWLLNAQHLHNVPGRKSDLIDSAWCCQLLEHGLVRPSFVPPPEIRRLRDLTRLCIAQTEERTRAIQRLEKVLQDAGIKLSSVASSTYSASARAMLEALLGGVSDPAALAELAKRRLRAKIPQLQEALANRFELAHHGVLVAGLLAHIDSLDQTVATLDARIAAATAPYAELVELLCTIPGVNVNTARVLIAECGLDMSVFGSAEHLVSWAAVCPGLNASAGRRRSGKTRHGNRWLRKALTEAAPRRRPQQEHLPRLPLLADPRPPRRRQSDRRHPPRHPDRLLPHRPRPRPLPRARPRLARPPPLRRAPHPPARQTTRSTRSHRHPRGRRLNH